MAQWRKRPRLRPCRDRPGGEGGAVYRQAGRLRHYEGALNTYSGREGTGEGVECLGNITARPRVRSIACMDAGFLYPG